MTTEVITLRFEDAAHRSLHAVLLSYGFSFEVSPHRKVGRIYWRRDKQLAVELSMADELRAVVKDLSKPIGQQILSGEDFAPDHQAWLDAADSEGEFLFRELQVLVSGR